MEEEERNKSFSLKARFTVEVELFGPGDNGEWRGQMEERYSNNNFSVDFHDVLSGIVKDMQLNSGYRVSASLDSTETTGEIAGYTNRVAHRRFQYLIDHLERELSKAADAMTDEIIFLDLYPVDIDFASQARENYIQDAAKEFEARLRRRLKSAANRPKDRDKATFPIEKARFVSRCWKILNEMKESGTKLSLSEFASRIHPPGAPIKNPERSLCKYFAKFGFTWTELKGSFEGKLSRKATTLNEEEAILRNILVFDLPQKGSPPF